MPPAARLWTWLAEKAVSSPPIDTRSVTPSRPNASSTRAMSAASLAGVGRACRTPHSVRSVSAVGGGGVTRGTRAAGRRVAGAVPADQPAEGLAGRQPAAAGRRRQGVHLPPRQEQGQLDQLVVRAGRV